ncbi:MAG: leucine-rich repeat protein [Lachnospiraceae bacterium]|nr:leucine-rich repeat protein [Lachnospiraceae bacterium]
MKKTSARRILPAILILALTVTLINPIMVARADESNTIFEYEVLNDNTAMLTACNYYGTELDIPDTIDGYKVKVLGADLCTNNRTLQSVTIPSSVREIESNTFSNCINLANITIPDGAVQIGSDTFAATAYVTNDANWSGGLLYIGNHLIAADKEYTDGYNLKPTTVSIADEAFSECSALSDITLPESVLYVSASSFQDTPFIKDESKYTDNGLYLGQFLIKAKEDTTGTFTIKEGTKKIASSAFETCDKITEVKFCDGLTSIGSQAFCFCNNLENVTLPASVTDIDSLAFYGCSKITSVTLPSNLTSFGQAVFDGCSGLTDINISGNSILSSEGGVLFNKDKSILVQYPVAKTDTSYTIPSGVTRVSSYAFRDADNLESVTLPEGLKELGTCAFHNCDVLDNLTFPSSIEKIGSIAFEECKSLNNITLPDKGLTIGTKAFYNCAYYANTDNWQDGMMYLGSHLLRVNPDNEGLCKIKAGTRTIGEAAFTGCSKITEVIIPEGAKAINAYAFNTCIALKTIKIPDSVKTIGEHAFNNCIELINPFVPDSVEEIGQNAIGFYQDKDTKTFTKLDECTVKCAVGSCAYNYAINAGLNTTTPGVIVKDGKSQQVIEYSDPGTGDYSNNNSEIIRFCVYVESDYDTDMDGKRDLVKAFIQLPKSAAYGEYKAPVLYEASPYSAGNNMYEIEHVRDNPISDSQLMSSPAKRTVSNKSDTLTQAENSKREDWLYTFDSDEIEEKTYYYDNIITYDDYLVSGYAVVLSAGLGTYGSEGVECCGTTMERDAFKNVVEWLHGDRVAYTDKENNIAIDADWSSGKVGMIGFSYSAAMAYEVAETGVSGLETIIAQSGPYSWYDYSNRQGLCYELRQNYDYNTYLSTYCASRFFTDYDKDAASNYNRFLWYCKNAQDVLRGNYGDFWANRDYTNPTNFNASVLFIQGLNDNNVTTKHFDLVRDKIINQGCEVKTILHQNNHTSMAEYIYNTDIMVGDYSSSDWLNMWFTHYLIGADNAVSTMPEFTVQDNVTGNFYGTDDWQSGKNIVLKSGDTKPHTVDPKNADTNMGSLYTNAFTGESSDSALCWSETFNEDITINGKIPVHLRVKTEYAKDLDLPMSVYLVDYCETPFKVFDPDTTPLVSETQTPGITNPKIITWKQSETNRKIITYGAVNLNNPAAEYEPTTAVTVSSPIKSGEYYDYTVYLDPKYYTVQAGHTLELYVVPFGYLEKPFLYSDKFTEEEMREMGAYPEDYSKLSRDYKFTVDNSSSYAIIPVTKTSANPHSNGGTGSDTSVYTREGEPQTITVRPAKTGDYLVDWKWIPFL